MPCKRHLIVCEGQSEWTYLQRLQSFLESQPLAAGEFDAPLKLICPGRVIAKGGTFGKLRSRFNEARKNERKASIQIWADFDLYHRNDNQCADFYSAKTDGIPDFLFSFHNFEDFFALHAQEAEFQQWLAFGGRGHFATPLHSEGYLPEIKKIFPAYAKGGLPAGFITWDSLNNLKRNKALQPVSNPRGWNPILSFADFLVDEIEKAFPGALA